MWSWLRFWNQSRKPAVTGEDARPSKLPPQEDLNRRASTGSLPSEPAHSPRYSFTTFDPSSAFRTAPRRGARAAPASTPASGSSPILGIDLGTNHASVAIVLDRVITP